MNQKRTINPVFKKVETIKYLEDGTYIRGLFFTKDCLFCESEFEAQRQETAFCSQRCQKAHHRKIILKQRTQEP